MTSIPPEHNAVVIVDMQNGFCHQDGSFARAGADVSGMGAAVAGCVSLIEAARTAGWPVVFTRAIHEGDLSDWPVLSELPMYQGLLGLDSCVEGTWDAEFVDGIAPLSGDMVVTKSRFSPFVETDLADRLRALGVENLLVGGVGTSACVESTVRDASQRNFRTFVVVEATGDISADAHQHSLGTMGTLFGWTATLDDVASRAEGHASA